MKRILFVALGLLLAGTAHAATEIREGGNARVDTTGAYRGGPATITPMAPLWVGGRTSDSTSVIQRFDSNGNAYIRDGISSDGYGHYWFGDESAVQIVGGGTLDTCHVGKANTASPTTAASLTPYSVTGQYLWVNVKNTTIAANYPWSVRFYASRDGTNYAPLMRSMTYWRSPSSGYGSVGTADDTLKITRRGPTGTTGNWYPLMADPALSVIARTIVAVCSNDSASATTGSTATFVITMAQRK